MGSVEQDSGLVECDAASLVNWFLHFQRFMVPSSSRQEQSKTLEAKCGSFLWTVGNLWPSGVVSKNPVILPKLAENIRLPALYFAVVFYRELDFSAVRPGARVLVKCEDCLWHRAVVLTCSSVDKCEVKLESSGKTLEVALHCILPLGMCDTGLCVCTTVH